MSSDDKAPWTPRDHAQERPQSETQRQLEYLKPITGEPTGLAPGEAALARGRGTGPGSESDEKKALLQLVSQFEHYPGATGLSHLWGLLVRDATRARAAAAPPAQREGVIPFADRPKVGDFTRRNRVDHWTPEERAIADAVDLVERMGAHVRLTDAVTLLADARDAVADFVDGRILAGQPAVSPATRLRDDVEQRLREAEGGR